jgi:hypothetical protein
MITKDKVSLLPAKTRKKRYNIFMRGNNILTNPPLIRKQKKYKATMKTRFILARETSDAAFKDGRALFLSAGSLDVMEISMPGGREKIGPSIGLSHAGVIYFEEKSDEPVFATFASFDRDTSGSLYPETSIIGKQGLQDELVFAYPIEEKGEVTVFAKDKKDRLYKTSLRKDTADRPPRWQRIYQEAVDLGVFLAADETIFLSYKDKDKDKNDNNRDVAVLHYPKEARQNILKIDEKIHKAEKFVMLGEDPLFLYKGEVLKSDGTPAIREGEEKVIDISASLDHLALLFASGRIEIQKAGKTVFATNDILEDKAPMFSQIDRLLIDEKRLMVFGKKARQAVVFQLDEV